MPFLIDGHNLIGQTPGWQLTDPEDEQRLIARLRQYLGRLGKQGVVVFDHGPQFHRGARRLTTGRLTIIFAAASQTADEVIIQRLARERNPRGITVVTSDQALARAARHYGATVMAAHVFARQMLAPPSSPRPKETGLTAEEAEHWLVEFKRRRK